MTYIIKFSSRKNIYEQMLLLINHLNYKEIEFNENIYKMLSERFNLKKADDILLKLFFNNENSILFTKNKIKLLEQLFNNSISFKNKIELLKSDMTRYYKNFSFFKK